MSLSINQPSPCTLTPAEAKLVDAVRSVMPKTPRLADSRTPAIAVGWHCDSLTSVIQNLRDKGWRRLPRPDVFADWCESNGFEVRKHYVGGCRVSTWVGLPAEVQPA